MFASSEEGLERVSELVEHGLVFVVGEEVGLPRGTFCEIADYGDLSRDVRTVQVVEWVEE